MGQLGSIYLDIKNWLQQHQNELVGVTESQGEFQNQKHPLPELVRNADLPSPLLICQSRVVLSQASPYLMCMFELRKLP